MLLADTVDALRLMVWMRSGGKKRDKPRPIPRPGVEKPEKKQFGNNPMDIDDMDAWLASRG